MIWVFLFLFYWHEFASGQGGNELCDFIASSAGLMWRAAPIFSTPPDYGDLMEPRTAESAPAAFRLTFARRWCARRRPGAASSVQKREAAPKKLTLAP